MIVNLIMLLMVLLLKSESFHDHLHISHIYWLQLNKHC